MAKSYTWGESGTACDYIFTYVSAAWSANLAASTRFDYFGTKPKAGDCVYFSLNNWNSSFN